MMMSYSNHTFFPSTDTDDVKTNAQNAMDTNGLSKEAGVSVPSIYLRPESTANTGEPPALQAQNPELDVLWSSSQNRTSLLKDETNPVLLLGGGFLGGVILTTLAFWLIFSPTSNPFQGTSPATTPKVVSQQQTVEPDAVNANATNASTTAPRSTPINPNVPIAQGTIYKVKSGDNLGSIALHVYGDSSPAMLDRILKANKLANANKLSLNQELIIPPKNY